jgi:hypothetical protein
VGVVIESEWITELVGGADNHTIAPRASDFSKRLTTITPRGNQAGTSRDDVWYVGLTRIIVLLIHAYRKAPSKPDEQNR